MLRGMAQMDLKRRLNANRALSATMSFLALIGWGAFAYSAGASARATRHLRDELAHSKAVKINSWLSGPAAAGARGLGPVQATLAAARGELETLARKREQAAAQVTTAQHELAGLQSGWRTGGPKCLETRRARVAERTSKSDRGKT